MSDLMKQFGIWNVRIVSRSESYGRNDCLCHDEDKELVEFYDTRYRNDKEWKRGQFVSRYYLETLLEDANRLYRIGLSLDGGIPEWTVTAEDMIKIIAWLRKFDAQRKENSTMKTVASENKLQSNFGHLLR